MRIRVLSQTLIILALPLIAAAAPAPPDFDRDIKPILQQHCFKCHGPEKQKGGLRLDQKPAAFRGGDSGEPAIVPGNRLKSHLIKLVTSNDPDEMMPPKGERLKPEEVAMIARWVETGAHWTDVNAAASAPVTEITVDRVITPEDRRFWSFIPPVRHQPPPVEDRAWVRSPIDQFILARQESSGLGHAGETSRELLIRRLTYDLTGLPPTPDEVRAFVKDQRPDAYEQLVHRLLSSPRFGERLASTWLPLARYAEDQAHQVGSDTTFFYPNAHHYRQWVVDAFNHDLPYDQFIVLQLAADKVQNVGLASASGTNGKSANYSENLAALGFLGLGPKYYGRGNITVMADEWEDRVDTVTRTTLGLTVACARCHDHKFDPVSTRDYYAMAGVFASTKMVNKNAAGAEDKPAKGKPMASDTLHIVEDDPQPKDLNVFIRGNVDRKGPVVPRRFLSILSPSEPMPFKDGSGRLELALAIASRENPLTARVIVNRIWGLMTGKPLVPTPSNFGRSGQPPTHPDLLDDLAVRFMDNGWSIKWLVREIALSSTYRQSSDANPSAQGVDPANDLLWRMSRRRLSIEQWRDTILSVAGTLQTDGGKSLELDDPTNLRRTLYARVSRLKLNDILNQFDYPDANVHAETRSITNTPTQKLFVLNHPFMIGQARALAARLANEVPYGDRSRVARAYHLIFGRDPTAAETDLAVAFLNQPTDSDLTRWEQYAQVLLASNEVLYVD